MTEPSAPLVPRTAEDVLRADGRGIAPGRSYRCPTCGNAEHAFAIVEGADGGWLCSSCRTAQAVYAAAEAGPPELSWNDIRGQRRVFLEASDWTQLPDVSEATRALWIDRRQRARDLTDLATPDEAQAALDALRAEAAGA